MLESGTPAVLKIETIGSLGSAGVPESQNHELYYGHHWYPPISVPKKKNAKQPITAFLSNRIYRNSSSDWLVGSFLFGIEIGGYH